MGFLSPFQSALVNIIGNNEYRIKSIGFKHINIKQVVVINNIIILSLLLICNVFDLLFDWYHINVSLSLLLWICMAFASETFNFSNSLDVSFAEPFLLLLLSL
jgi:hypothetical protein